MAMKLEEVKFGGMTLTLVEHPKYGWGLPARALGLVLGYSGQGQTLADQCSHRWAKLLGSDAVVLTGEELVTFKAAVGLTGPDAMSSSLLFLTGQGVRTVFAVCTLKTAKELRVQLARSDSEAVKSFGLSEYATRPPRGLACEQSPRNRGLAREQSPEATLKSLLSFRPRRSLFTDEELKAYVGRAIERCLGNFKAPAPVEQPALPAIGTGAGFRWVLPKDGKVLEGDHPDLVGHYVTTTEIGRAHGFSASKALQYTKLYCETLGFELPSNRAMKLCEQANGLLKTDGRGYLVFHCPEVNAYARYTTRPTGRNYWAPCYGPEAMKTINALIEADPKRRRGAFEKPRPVQADLPLDKPTNGASKHA